jgi:hypothetical protein
MFVSSLPLVVCRRSHILYTWFVFVCICWCPAYIVLCSCFVCLRLVCPMLSASPYCPFLSANTMFSNVYWICLNLLIFVVGSRVVLNAFVKSPFYSSSQSTLCNVVVNWVTLTNSDQFVNWYRSIIAQILLPIILNQDLYQLY